MRRLACAMVLLSLPLATACGDDATMTGSDSDADTGDTGSTGDDTTGTDTAADTGEPPAPLAARDIAITDITADQGVQVPVAAGGLWVDGNGRNAYLVANRSTLVRLHVDVDEAAWSPREIVAHLTLHFDDGTSEAAYKALLVEKDSSQTDWDSTFFWYIPPELIRAGMHIDVRLEEKGQELAGTPEPAVSPIFPAEGAGKAYLGIEDSYGYLDVALVPVKHELEGKTCPPAPDIDNEQFLKRMHDNLMSQNPVERVDLTVLPELVYTNSMQSFGGLLSVLSQLRQIHDAPPEQYYYGLVVPCDGGADGVGGQAFGIPVNPTKSNAYQRVSMGRFYGSQSATAGTFTHEVGHSQGRYHVLCSGGEGGADPSYPYPNGDIGVYGFDIFSWTVHTPKQKDYMTYCGNTWVSDWAWNKVHNTIQILSSWEMEGPEVEPDGTLLIGALYPDNTEEWWTAPGDLAGEVTSTAHDLAFATASGPIEVPVVFNRRPDGDTYNLVAELPTSLDEVTAIVRRSPDGDHPVPLPTIKRLADG